MQVYSAQWFKVHLTYIWDKINLSPIIHQVNTTMFDSSSSQDTCFLLTHSKKKAFVGMHTAHLCCIAIVQISGSTTCVQRERDVCPSRLMCSAQNAINMGKLCLSSNSQTFYNPSFTPLCVKCYHSCQKQTTNCAAYYMKMMPQCWQHAFTCIKLLSKRQTFPDCSKIYTLFYLLF